jgi:hypothetical protein
VGNEAPTTPPRVLSGAVIRLVCAIYAEVPDQKQYEPRCLTKRSKGLVQ